MIDLQVLRIVKYRTEFYKFRGRVPEAAMDSQTNALLADFQHYFEQLPDHDKIKHASFLTIFRARHPTLTAEQRSSFEKIIKHALETDVPEDEKNAMMRSLLELRLGTQIANLIASYDAGDIANLPGAIGEALDGYKADAGIRGLDYLQDDIDDLLSEEVDDTGLRWRLAAMNESARGLRPGDFGIIAGRPDKGKTTFIASELTHLAAQLPEGQCAIWLNNEGPGKRIIPRLYQAALGATMSQLVALRGAGKTKEAYAKVMGAVDRIRIVDIHNCDNFTVESIVEQHKPGIVVYDMIDNIRGFGDAARTDLGLERMYQWARELAVKHEHAGLATSQISNDGDGLQFPTLGMLKDSKTGKQGACDFQIMIGASNDPGLAGLRYIGLPKNKLRREGAPADPRATVKYDPARARYEDITEVAGDAGETEGTSE